jgi:ribosomal-protein-alanine N-acetyltransferase
MVISGAPDFRPGPARTTPRRRWPVTLDHGPVRLRPLHRRDQPDWDRVRRANYDWLKPWEATLPPGADPGPGSWAGLIATFRQQARDGRMLPWAICYDERYETAGPPARHVLAGQLTVSGIVGGSASLGSIGYWVDQRWAGRGVVPTAVAMAVDHCFDVLGLHRIEIAIRPENAKSLRVVEKLGFRAEGVRPRFLHIDHDWRDHLIFALHAEEVPGGLLARWSATRHTSGS